MTGEKQSTSRKARNDNAPPPPSRTLLADLLMGLRFYSRLPTGSSPHESPTLNRMAPALPFVSVIIGLVPALILSICTLAGAPPLFAAGLAIAASALVTGAMAEDAIADAADGLFGGRTPERRLEILKDSRHGTFGVTALVLFILLRVAGFGAIAESNAYAAGAFWLGITLLARSGALWLPYRLGPARTDGAAAAAGQINLVNLSAGAGFAVLIGLLLIGPFTSFLTYLITLCVLAAITYGWTRLCKQLVGGQTGDLIGALQALLEIAALSTLMLRAGAVF